MRWVFGGEEVCSGLMIAETGSARKIFVAASRLGRRGYLLISLKVCIPPRTDSNQLTDA